MKNLLSSPRIRISVAVTLAGALIVVLAALALQRSDATPEPTARSTSSSARPGANVGDIVNPVQATSTDGRAVQVPGDLPTVVFFMASWCSPCLVEGQAIAAVEDDYAGRVQFVAVNVTPGDPVEAVQQFQQAAGNPGHPYVTDTSGAFVEQYAVRTLDTTVVVGPDGRVQGRIDARSLNEQQLRQLIDTSLS